MCSPLRRSLAKRNAYLRVELARCRYLTGGSGLCEKEKGGQFEQWEVLFPGALAMRGVERLIDDSAKEE